MPSPLAALAVIGVIVSITMSINRILMVRFRMFVFVIVFSPFLHKMKSFVRLPISVIVMRAQKGASRPKKLRSDRACKSTMVIGAAQKSRLRNSSSLSVCLSVYCKNYAISYSNRISFSKSSFRKSFFVLPRLAWHILVCDFTLFQTKKPHPFCQKGWENANFF